MSGVSFHRGSTEYNFGLVLYELQITSPIVKIIGPELKVQDNAVVLMYMRTCMY